MKKNSWKYDSVLFSYYQKNKRRRLREKYGFDEWHTIPIYEKPYIKECISILDNPDIDKKGTLVEVGCGLGDIIGNCNWSGRRVGYDLSKEVINAKEYFFKNNKYKVGGFEDITEREIECLIMVNFIHGIPLEELRDTVQNLLKEKKINAFMIDSLNRTKYSEYEYVVSGGEIFGNEYQKQYESKKIKAAHGAVRTIELWKKV